MKLFHDIDNNINDASIFLNKNTYVLFIKKHKIKSIFN